LTEFNLRDYKSNDFSQLFELWQATGLATKGRGDNQNIIEKTLKADAKLLVLTHTNKIIGSSWITNDGRRLYLHHFGIHPDFQGKKISHILLKASLEFAHEKGMQIKLEVSQKNQIAANLYKRYGFKYLGDYDVYIIRDTGSIQTGSPN
jgi:ribosomal protein S18 acetylase RimI-like enzyme